MVKRKGADKESATTKSTRKRVPFSAPKNARTRATIERNASTSPLLRLPLEVRTKIWIEVLGDRLVHLKHHGFEAWGNPWRHLVCQEDCTENAPDHETTWCEFDGEERTVRHRPHSDCTDYVECEEIPMASSCDESMSLTLLRSCRQIYVEANQLLWATNTFSFHDSDTFTHFIKTRNINQKRILKAFRIEMEWSLFDGDPWNSALIISVVRSLSGLRRIRLCIAHGFEADLYEHSKGYDFLQSTKWTEGLRKLSTLPLTSAEVVVRLPYPNQSAKGLWTASDREEVANDLRDILLNPRGAEIYAEAVKEQQKWSKTWKEEAAAAKASMYRAKTCPTV